MDDVSLETGLPTRLHVYSARQQLRTLDCSLPEDGGDGAMLLLPHSCSVQLEMLRLDNRKRK